jgi:Ca-activated chloride channel family protein
MRIKVGDRIIDGQVKPREEARRIYDEAKNQGKTAALLDQERPNIFTQSVANIMPGKGIEVEISYIQILKFEHGTYEFSYPMVVGPRYTGQGTIDPGKITPPITPKGTRTGAGIDLSVNLDAGMPIEAMNAVLHDVDISRKSESRAIVRLAKKDEIPNRDFILRYQVAGKQVKSAFLAYADPKLGGFFTMILMPPKNPTPEQIAPKEIVFVMDQSGSQSGFPIQKSKELTSKLIDTLNAGDTFNVISFSNTCNYLWKEPQRVSDENIRAAKAFVSGLDANGGTHLIDAVRGAQAPAIDPKRRRFIVFNTDGYIGNEYEVLEEIRKNGQNSRMFTFGIGNSVNRFLIDSMGIEGRGDAEYVTLAEEADPAVSRFLQRTKNPVLVDVSLRFDGIDVVDVLPAKIPDVFGDHPIIIKGRYLSPGKGSVLVSGLVGDNEPWRNAISVDLPDLPGGAFSLDENLQASKDPIPPTQDPTISDNSPLRSGSSIAKLWARSMVDEVARTDYLAMQRGDGKSKAAQQITRLGLAFGIMTQYTSFVAVENRVVNVGGKQRTIRVPVEMADGVSYEGIYGNERLARDMSGSPSNSYYTRGTTFAGVRPGAYARTGGGTGGAGGGTGGSSGGGGGTTTAASPPATKGKLGFVSYDPTDNSIIVRGFDPKTFDKLTNPQVETYSSIAGSKQEIEVIKALTPIQRVRYLLLTRVTRELRESKKTSLEVQIEFKAISVGLKFKLEAAGLKVALFDEGLRIAVGTCGKDALKKLALVEGVMSVKPL